ncbi:MAG: hypothetical protein PF694_04840 [Bacteroidetes bacterium]|jgi:hypothetical protein|nr:hypothetical protein [Bacteroidota bacterium]
MKKSFFQLMLTLSLILFASIIFAQSPPAPPPEHGSGTNETGGGAPLGSGIGILLALGAAYGGRKIYKAWKDKDQIED